MYTVTEYLSYIHIYIHTHFLLCMCACVKKSDKVNVSAKKILMKEILRRKPFMLTRAMHEGILKNDKIVEKKIKILHMA